MASAGGTEYVLAIDLGSGGPKAALVSDRGEIVERVRGTTGIQFLPNGGAEQDPAEWWSSITGCVRELVARRTVPVEDIIAVSIDSQWSVVVPVDAAGEPLMNAIHWTDSRGAPYTKRITDGPIKIAGYGARKLLTWIKYTGGVPPHSGADSLSHILYIKNERPDIYDRTFKFLEPMDYINMRLTGRFAASPATIYAWLLTDNRDVNRIDYAPQLVEWAELDRQKLPDLQPAGSMLGLIRPEVAEEWGLGRHTEVVIGTADSQAAVLGSGAAHDYQGHVCIGTSSWLSCHVPFKKTNIFRFLATMPAAIPGRNMVMAEQGAAGKCLEVFIDNWLFANDGLSAPRNGVDVYDQLLRLAGDVPAGSHGLLFLPWLNGAGPPTGDGEARGGFLNQTLQTNRAHAARAVLEGISFNLRWLLHYVEKFIHRRMDSLNFIGGAARSETWCQILADVMNRPIRQVVDPAYAIARGAAFSALISLGRLKLDDLPAKVKIAKIYEPIAEHRTVYDTLFAEFVRSFNANRRTFARLRDYRGSHRIPTQKHH